MAISPLLISSLDAGLAGYGTVKISNGKDQNPLQDAGDLAAAANYAAAVTAPYTAEIDTPVGPIENLVYKSYAAILAPLMLGTAIYKISAVIAEPRYFLCTLQAHFEKRTKRADWELICMVTFF